MFTYRPDGVCCHAIDVELEGDRVKRVKFHGGCDGNLNAVSKLVEGLSVERVSSLLEGNTCHRHDDTSCADQLVKALRSAQSRQVRHGTLLYENQKRPTIASGRMTRRDFVAAALAGLVGAATIGPAEALASTPTRSVEDSLGRVVDVPVEIDGAVPLGDVAQTLVLMLRPEALSTVASTVCDEDAAELEEAGCGEVARLPESGGGSSSDVGGVDVGEVRRARAAVMIDAGLWHGGLVDELDALQAEVQVPCVFVDVSFGRLPAALRTLGGLLGCEGRAEELAVYVEGALEATAGVCPAAEHPLSVFYAPRALGISPNDGVPVQIAAIQHVGAVPVSAPYDFGARAVQVPAVDEVDPDLVVFDDTDSLPALCGREGEAWEVWKGVRAVEEGRFVMAPALLNSWFGSLVHAQSIGALWLASVVSPGACGFDVVDEAGRFYALFYGVRKDEGEYMRLVGREKTDEED